MGVKGLGLTRVSAQNHRTMRAVEEGGIPGVVVKCIEIRRNTGGEGGLLGWP